MPDKKMRGISNRLIAIPDVPDAPTVSATNVGTGRAYNNGAATVTITPTTGGLPTSYSITTTPTTVTTTATSSPATITGLSSATSYTATVTPSNVSATGPVSTSAAFTATTVPAAPTAVSGTSNLGAVTVSFTPGATGGSSITSYTVLSSSGASNTGVGSGIVVTETVTGSYTYTVTATNANGTSLASTASSSVFVGIPIFESIATVNPTSGASVTFSSIPATYSHLQIRYYVFTTGSAATAKLTFNGDTAANYAYFTLEGSNSLVSTLSQGSQSSINVTGNTFAIGGTPYPTVGIVDIYDYAKTNKHKSTQSFSGQEPNSYNSNGLGFSSGLWSSTSAITSLTLTMTGVTLATGSKFALYGVK